MEVTDTLNFQFGGITPDAIQNHMMSLAPGIYVNVMEVNE